MGNVTYKAYFAGGFRWTWAELWRKCQSIGAACRHLYAKLLWYKHCI